MSPHDIERLITHISRGEWEMGARLVVLFAIAWVVRRGWRAWS